MCLIGGVCGGVLVLFIGYAGDQTPGAEARGMAIQALFGTAAVSGFLFTTISALARFVVDPILEATLGRAMQRPKSRSLPAGEDFDADS